MQIEYLQHTPSAIQYNRNFHIVSTYAISLNQQGGNSALKSTAPSTKEDEGTRNG